MKFLIVGAGAWGTGLAQVLNDNKHEVYIYGNVESIVDEINNSHTNSAYFGKDVILDDKISAVSSYDELLNEVDAVVIAVPSKAYRSVLEDIASKLTKKIYFVSVGKGFDPNTEERLTSTIRHIIPEEYRYPIVSLIGPSHAEEVILRMLTCVTSTCLDLQTGKVIQHAFSNDYFRVYTNQDEVGAEYAAAIKNVIAIASGILSGLGYGDNTRAALVTRGLAEMLRFGLAMGGKETTYLGLTGLGDLMVTCTSLHSRNFQAGYQIGKDDTSEKFLNEYTTTVEGIRTSKVIMDKAKEIGVEMPVVEAVYAVLFENKRPSMIINQLMNRPLKTEF